MHLLAYYAQRAHECEQVYEKPERQPDLHQLRIWLRDALAGYRILEIACGTGYWTEAVAMPTPLIASTGHSQPLWRRSGGRTCHASVRTGSCVVFIGDWVSEQS